MKKIKLFNFEYYRPILEIQNFGTDSTRSDKIFANKLMQLNQELRGQDFDLAIFSKKLLSDFIFNRGLEQYAMRKNMDIDYTPNNNGTQISRSFTKLKL